MNNPIVGKAVVSLLAMTWAGAAMAQTTDATPGAEDAGSDIVVTAQRRSERLVDVPLSVAAVSGDEIERAGATSLENITKVVPGIYMQRDVYGLSPTVRGIGSTLPSSGGEANVSVYVDGVYLAYRATNIFDLASVSNLQVLKGPQGTLFGRNATGGAVLISTLDPGFDFAGKAKVSYERFGQVRASGYLNVPFSDTIAANAAVSYRHSRGYIRDNRTNDIVNKGEDYSFRGKLLFKPSDDLSFILTGYHSSFDDPTGASYQAIEPAPFYLQSPLDSGPIAYDRYHRSHNIDPEVKTKSDMFSFHANWEMDAGTIQSITAWQKGRLRTTNDLDSTYQSAYAPLNLYASFRSQMKVFTQEVNFTSKPGSDLEYVAGLFYYRSRSAVPYFAVGGVPTQTRSSNARTMSAYFDGSWRFDNLVFIGGLRYTREKRGVDSSFFPSGARNVATEKEGVWTPRVGVRYELTPRSNVYATYTRGYKAGVFDETSLTGNRVDPEFVNAYEIGYKLSEPGFTFNTAAYYYDFTDTQVTAVANQIRNGQLVIFSQLYNVPKTQIYGLEAETTYRFSDAFDIRAAAAYTHARYKEFTNAPAFGPGSPVFTSLAVNANGNHAVRAPDFTFSGALNYHAALGGEMRLDASVSGAYSSRVYFDFPNDMSQAGYLLVDANVNLTVNDKLTVSVFGRNLTDKIYYTFNYATSAGRYGNFGMPRTYGVSLGYTF